MDPLNGSFQGNEQKGSYLWAFLITVIVCIGAAGFIFPQIYPYIFENKELDSFLTKVTILFLLSSIFVGSLGDHDPAIHPFLIII
jgi:hypothetical protein